MRSGQLPLFSAAPLEVLEVKRLGVPLHLQTFEPSHAAALQRLANIRPVEYARSRNALDGAVTGLSPYFTHGVLRMDEAARVVHQRYPLRDRKSVV